MKKHNLPAQVTSFVGRSQEISEIIDLLNKEDCRLLTLLGAGGIGKTRLAIEVASHSVGNFANGIFFIPLDPLASAENIISTVATILGFQFHEGRTPQKQLLDYLRERQLLLIMDNFEHLLEGADFITDVLKSAPQVKVLVTSREALNLQEEWIRHIKGMRFPDTDQIEDIEPYSALKLFIERARRVRGDFDDTTCAIEICRLLEGLPLAIELAAAWLKTLPCRKVVNEIKRNIDFLETNMRDIPERHRSMRAVFDHSWSLLSTEEQAVFRKLAVFRGGFEQDAAEQVAGTSLYILASLVDKSLLRITAPGRYQIHELMRQYGAELLQKVPEIQKRVRDLHCEYYTEFLHHREPELNGVGKKLALEMIEGEIDNVRVAWNHAVAGEKIPEIRRSLESLFEFYLFRAWNQEADNALGRAVEVLQVDEPVYERSICLGLALVFQGMVCQVQGKHRQATELSGKGVSILRGLGVARELSIALHFQAMICYNQSDFRTSQVNWEESLTLATIVDDRFIMARACDQLGILYRLVGKYREAEHFLQEGLAIFRQIKSPLEALKVARHLGDIALDKGSYEESLRYYQESLIAHKEIDSRWDIAQNLENLGHIAHALGEFEKARELYQECQSIAEEIGALRRIAFSLIGLGNVAYSLGELDHAQEHYQNSLAIANEIGQAWQKIRSLRGLGRVAYQQGNYTQSRGYHEESQVLCQAIGLQLELVQALNELGKVAVARKKNLEAKAYFQDALKIGIEIELPPVLLESFTGISELLVTMGKLEQAVELLSVSLHHPTSHADTKSNAKLLLRELEPKLPPDVFGTTHIRGKNSNPLIIAVSLLAELAGTKQSALSSQSLVEPLSAREIEVLALVADGLSNREIASELIVTVGTVKKHINNIFGKLQVRSRTQAVAKAQSIDLLS